MINALEVGKLFKEGITKYMEGIVFDINDLGCNLIIRYNTPSNKEIQAIQNSKIKVGYYTDEEIIFMLFKFEGLQWMDSPYSVYLSKYLTNIPDVNEGQGFALNIYLIDADTGILKVMRMVGLSTGFSKKLKYAIEKQYKIPYDNQRYKSKIYEIYNKYSTKQLVDYADLFCSI